VPRLCPGPRDTTQYQRARRPELTHCPGAPFYLWCPLVQWGRGTQNPPRATSCEFDSRLGHFAPQQLRSGFTLAPNPLHRRLSPIVPLVPDNHISSPAVTASRIWVRGVNGDFQELTAGSSVTVGRGTHAAGQWEREVQYRIESAGELNSLPVRYEMAINPQL
jgi:hypothetical protein